MTQFLSLGQLTRYKSCVMLQMLCHHYRGCVTHYRCVTHYIGYVTHYMTNVVGGRNGMTQLLSRGGRGDMSCVMGYRVLDPLQSACTRYRVLATVTWIMSWSQRVVTWLLKWSATSCDTSDGHVWNHVILTWLHRNSQSRDRSCMLHNCFRVSGCFRVFQRCRPDPTWTV